MISSARAAKGFTLIEIMIVVAIIGVLSSVAYPFLGRATMRSKSAEKLYLVDTLHSAIEDVYRLNDAFPTTDMASGGSITGAFNPTGLPGTGKRLFDPSMTNWGLITKYLQIEGSTYYSYSYEAHENDSPGATVYVRGNLDGTATSTDNCYLMTVVYERQNGAYMMVTDPTESKTEF